MFRLLKLTVWGMMLMACVAEAAAQDLHSKDGIVLWGIGTGYEWMPDAYSANGLSIDAFSRFYLSERLFCGLTAHWGTHSGEKTVMQQGAPFGIADQRDCLMLVVGPGFDLWQSASKRFCCYAKAMIGYGMRNHSYDDYQPTDGNDGLITLGCKTHKRGFALMAGMGFDWGFRRWILTPAIDAAYVGRQCDLSLTLSAGYYF
ncbi:MAG: hypothetical protein NC388_09550 [Clostridium sp.]|nr:hypothetical protein [Clostridium sp.]